MSKKKILITGAASGLGKAIATLYASQGWRVLVADIQDELGHAFVDALNNNGQSAEYYHCDIGQAVSFD
ncbi:MAG TPA: SDR family NAD(P)-dependent oxidoreductase, partial [Oceanospirillales bacterium]|nr:SDR family NAD(P)-dependent oxidoreductase [Oceanospirillales bacterium]